MPKGQTWGQIGNINQIQTIIKQGFKEIQV